MAAAGKRLGKRAGNCWWSIGEQERGGATLEPIPMTIAKLVWYTSGFLLDTGSPISIVSLHMFLKAAVEN